MPSISISSSGGDAQLSSFPQTLHMVLSWLLVLVSYVGGTEGRVDPGGGLSRVFAVEMSSLRAGPTWILVSWGPDLTAAGAEGELGVVISYMWSTMPGHTNTVYQQPVRRDRSRGFYPTRHNITGLMPDTWYAVCINATHTVSTFLKPTFSCNATRTRRANGNRTTGGTEVIGRNYSLHVGATWMDIRIRQRDTPFTIVHWMVVAKTSEGSPVRQEVHYQDHWHEPASPATDGSPRPRGTNTGGMARVHAFHFDDLVPHTSYFVTIEAFYKVNIKGNDALFEYDDGFVITTLVSGAGRGAVSLVGLVVLAVAWASGAL